MSSFTRPGVLLIVTLLVRANEGGAGAGPSPRTAREEILALAVDQRLDFLHVLGIADRSARGLDRDQVMASALQLLDRLLTDGLIRVGDMAQTGFTPWSTSTDAILVRIRTAWLTLDRQVGPGNVCWIEATRDGRAMGEAVLERTGLTDG
jgi:hypothetical protein